MPKYPILVIIPHGGYKTPEELAEISAMDDFGLFIEADTCANEIFDMRQITAALLDFRISRLFIDTDRPYTSLPPKENDGVIKTYSLRGKAVFNGNCFPDEIALAAILKRYYEPFHETIRNILETGEIRLIIDCHTVMPIGPRNAADAGVPRPIASVENQVMRNGTLVKTCPDKTALAFLSSIEASFSKEKDGIVSPFVLKNDACNGYIMERYAKTGIPVLRLNISKSLFLNEKYFSYDFLRVDELRLREIKVKIEEAIKRFARALL
jgi:formiminoglutamase